MLIQELGKLKLTRNSKRNDVTQKSFIERLKGALGKCPTGLDRPTAEMLLKNLHLNSKCLILAAN